MRRETNTVFVDVDGTLLIWPTSPGQPKEGEKPSPNWKLVNKLRNDKSKHGTNIVVWTKGGEKHARMAVDVCGISDIVCMAISKPDCFVDDSSADMFIKKMPVLSPDRFGE